MVNLDRLLERILAGRSDANIPFTPTCQMLQRIGFKMRIKASHHIFTYPGVVGRQLNLQPESGQVKPYQVRQIRRFLKEDLNYA